ncbi:MAG: cellulase family glycosylhydrolase, partial [Thermoproteota archaeon]
MNVGSKSFSGKRSYTDSEFYNPSEALKQCRPIKILFNASLQQAMRFKSVISIMVLTILLTQYFSFTGTSQSGQIVLSYDFNTRRGETNRWVDVNGDSNYDYRVDINNWNIRSASGGITMTFDPSTITLSVTANIQNAQPVTWVNGYPEIYFGRKPWDTQYANGLGVDFPLKVADLASRSLPVSFSIDIQSLHPPMSFNMAADAWIVRQSVANSPSKAPSQGDVELMVWVFSQNLGPAGSKVGEESIGGRAWEVWRMESVSWGGWQYIAFVPKGWSLTKGSISYDIAEFVRATARYTTFDISNHYLLNWEIGTEWGAMNSDGIAQFQWTISGFRVNTTLVSPSPAYDFETGKENWNGWDAITSVTQTTTDAKIGVGSLKCYFNQSINEDGKISVTFSSLKNLSGMRLSAWVKVPTRDFMIKIFAQDEDWTWLDAGGVDAPPPNMWAQVTWDLPKSTVDGFDPTKIKRVGVMFGRWGKPKWNGYVYMDAFGWQPIPPPTDTPLTLPSGMFRGINIGNALEAPYEGGWGVVIKDEYFRIIKEAGFDTVRIPIRWSAHASQNPPYTIDENFFKRVDHVVNKALEQGLTTIINIHHYEEIVQNPDKHSGRFLALWRQIAERYKNYSERLYFELLNEPCLQLTSDIWNQFVKDALNVIRTTNPTRKVIIGPTNWNSVYHLKYLEVPDDPNIIVTFHFYTPFEFTHQGAEWVDQPPTLGRMWSGTDVEKNQIMNELNIAFEWAAQRNLPLLMGEFGAYSKADMDSRARWTSFVAREAEKRGIAWCYWEFCSGFGAYDPVKNEWREPLLNALIPEQPKLASVASINLSKNLIRPWENITITGRVSPARITSVIIKASTDQVKWMNIAQVNSANDGTYSYTWTPNDTEVTYYLHSSTPASAGYVAAESSVVSLSVTMVPDALQQSFLNITLPTGEKCGIKACSTSTFLNVGIDTSEHKIIATVSGSDGTTGITAIFLPKKLLDTYGVTTGDILLTVDGVETIPYAITSPAGCVIIITYFHSGHTFTVYYATYQLMLNVKDYAGNPLANATVKLAGPVTRITNTNESGIALFTKII